MNETSALLANLVQTKSIQRVLAPIAAQVNSLGILIYEWKLQNNEKKLPRKSVAFFILFQIVSDFSTPCWYCFSMKTPKLLWCTTENTFLKCPDCN